VLHTITLLLLRPVALVDPPFMVVTVPWEAYLTMAGLDRPNHPKLLKLLEEVVPLGVLMMHLVAGHTKAKLSSTTAPSKETNKAAEMI
jgi:hypothetical protein